ncbi:SLAP domain-containing protein [Lactobacillus sp. ESL0681]|uniref:SLAP domain-containing protein n=1 Tax=Lactobacillus sp. ESL0681 TaxID=2983211 RepID=UPI0023FA2396|nr:SLAP domain-containing protein [Lactobacillus sp. ESL0681]WEV39778.1 SLAP domain-containing protein [Lactobacillus sp. ESL0681]
MGLKNKKIRRNVLVVIIALGSVFSGLNMLLGQTDVSNAATIQTAVHEDTGTAKTGKIKKKSYVYNSKGKRANKKILKKNKTVKVYGTKVIKDKTYYSLGNGYYVPKNKVKLSQKLTVVKKSYLYTKKGKRNGKKVLKKGKTINVYGTKNIKGKKYYSLGNGQYILATNVTVRQPEPVPNPVDSIDNNLNNSSSVSQPDKTDSNSSANEASGTSESGTVNNDSGNSINNSANNIGGNSAGSTGGSSATSIADFSLSDFRKAFITALNNERSKRGLTTVTEDPEHDDVVQKRSQLLPNNFSHTDKNGSFILEDYYKNAGISYYSIGECLAMYPWGWVTDHDTNELIPAPDGGSSADVAQNMIYEYIYNDADSNWGHRDILLNPNQKTIGLGAVVALDSGQIYSAVGLTY